MIHSRPVRLAIVVVLAVFAAIGAWSGFDALLTPRVPAGDASPVEVVSFLVDPRGLPRLAGDRQEEILREQAGRMVRDAGFRQSLSAVIRRSPRDEQASLRGNLFGALRPRVLADIRGFHDRTEAGREDYLDEKIVVYNRLATLFAPLRDQRDALGDALADPLAWQRLLLERVSAHERELGAAYVVALFERVKAILADPEQKRKIEERIASVE